MTFNYKNSNSKNLNQCPICKNKSKIIHRSYSYEKTINKRVVLKIKQCKVNTCGHVFLGQYNKKQLSKHYQYPRYMTKSTKGDLLYNKSRYNFIKNSSQKINHNLLLEIGPGDGLFLKFLNFKKKYFYDLSKNVIKNLRKFKFYNIKKRNKKFDLIVCCHVLEHSYNPILFLKNIKKNLDVNGKVFIEVPDFSYFGEPHNIDPLLYEHLHYFSIKVIYNLFDYADLEIISIKRILLKNNRTCNNYALFILAKSKLKSEKSISKFLSSRYINEKKIINKYLFKNLNILVWGMGTTFFNFAFRNNLQSKDYIYFTDIRLYNRNIFNFKIEKPSKFKEKIFDLLIITTADISNVLSYLKKLKIVTKKILHIKN